MYEYGCEPQRCCDYTTKPRHFLCKDEEIEILKSYKKELEKEIKGVEERINEITE